MTLEQRNELERLIDRHSIHKVLIALSELCCEKAEHVRHDWQDHALERNWLTLAHAIDKTAAKARFI